MSQDCINELINFTVKLAAWLTDWPTYQTSDQTTAWQKFTENEERSPQETLLKINFEELLNAKESHFVSNLNFPSTIDCAHKLSSWLESERQTFRWVDIQPSALDWLGSERHKLSWQ